MKEHIWILFEDDQYGNKIIKEWSSEPLHNAQCYVEHIVHEGICNTCYLEAEKGK